MSVAVDPELRRAGLYAAFMASCPRHWGDPDRFGPGARGVAGPHSVTAAITGCWSTRKRLSQSARGAIPLWRSSHDIVSRATVAVS
jgi:hypothetical protein